MGDSKRAGKQPTTSRSPHYGTNCPGGGMTHLFRLLRHHCKRYLRHVRRPLTEEDYADGQMW